VIKIFAVRNQVNQIPIAIKAGHFFFWQKKLFVWKPAAIALIYFTNKKKMLTSKVLKEYAAVLEPLGFVRIHRTHLVNKKHIAFVSNNGIL